MNSKVAREGFVQSRNDLDESREKLFRDVTGGIVKTAGNKVQKAEEKAEKQEAKQETKEEKFKEKMTKKEAEDAGFFKAARQCGWGIYSISDLDGGAGSVWYLEKDATTGEEYLVKQVNQVGDVVRRFKK